MTKLIKSCCYFTPLYVHKPTIQRLQCSVMLFAAQGCEWSGGAPPTGRGGLPPTTLSTGMAAVTGLV